ncbi:MAG: protein-export chaperone SecB [Magnetovibrionaceae bacterium]
MAKEPTDTTPETDENAAALSQGAAATEAEAEQPLVVNAQYIKDLSFEAPTTPTIFAMMQQEKPDIQVNIDCRAEPLQDRVFEVVLEIKGECTVGESTAFVAEISYAGVFTVNVPDEHRQPVLLIECPRLIFPFARAVLADVTRDGGFPPLMLGPVDFVAMYRNTLERMAAEKGEAES